VDLRIQPYLSEEIRILQRAIQLAGLRPRKIAGDQFDGIDPEHADVLLAWKCGGGEQRQLP
jgi:hypothetical protein